MSKVDRVTDQSILDDARLQRGHEERLAKIEAERDAKLAYEKRVTAASRHMMLGVVTGILAMLALILTVILLWKSNVDADRDRRDRQLERTDEVAEMCIRSGNIWIDGSCLIARSE